MPLSGSSSGPVEVSAGSQEGAGVSPLGDGAGAGDGGDVFPRGDGVAPESRQTRAARGPTEPSDEERRRRECTRVPFRSWRTRCARA
eukprot:15460870-Alexandrium_andersonii.AAC.1